VVFSSPIFLFCFLPITLLLAWLSHNYGWRNKALLVFSALFYAFGEGELLLLMFGTITLNFFIGKWIGRSKTKTAVVVGVVINLLVLAIYKYATFVIVNINSVLDLLGAGSIPVVEIKLPVGISFYIFQTMSYLIDVYRKQNESQKSYVDLALYVCLFPQLIAGPIVRYKDIADQLKHRTLGVHKFAEGLQRFIIGLGKKVIIANTLGSVADQMLELNTSEFTMGASWLAMICYSLQLYFDFSAYSDMAIGLGKMFGFDFLENFRFPYKAKSIREFWQRWHISLSNWFRDYLYIPLGGNRVSPGRVYVNLFIVFFLTGLWHGASWNFVIWGMMHGCFMVVERLGFEKLLRRTPAPLQHIYTLMVVIVAWVFFRVESFTDAGTIISNMFVPNENGLLTATMFINSEGIFALTAGLIMSFDGFNYLLRKVVRWYYLSSGNRVMFKTIFRNLRSIFLIIIFVYSALITASGSYNPFIYFRF
jgi:alginate O-acetyltransferase complex protein AlgI